MQTKTLFFAAAAAAISQFAMVESGHAVTPDRGLLKNAANHSDIILVQATDPRVVQLEEQVRQMTGQIEELNFLLLQMQEQLRKMQEDNDFRFQELEGSGGTPEPERKSRVQSDEQTVAGGGETTLRGDPPRNLGEVVINPDGSVKGATLGEPMDLLGNRAATDETVVAALPATNDPAELYSNAYEFILSGDYKTAEAGFREHVERFPNDERSADAHYWLGESILSQQRPAEAAEVFLAASRDFPDARKAPDMLLKLGMSLAALGQRDIACATFKEVNTRYPGASDILKGRVSQEQAIAGC